jgi:hypothetical protein
MLKLYKISPMVRAVGTMGAVAALVGGITFALGGQQSPPVTLSDTTVATETAGLGIADGACATDTLPTSSDITASGDTITNLAPGVASTDFDFCLANTGSAPQDITFNSSSVITATGDLTTSDVTLNVTCTPTGTGIGATASLVLDTLGATPNTVTTGLGIAPGSYDNCTESATLGSTYTGTGGSLSGFDLDFMGTTTS